MSGEENSLDAWLARVGAPSAPIQGEAGRWYRFGYLEAALANGKPQAGEDVEQAVEAAIEHTLAYAVQELAEAVGVSPKDDQRTPEELFAELIAMVAEKFGGDGIVDDPFSDDELPYEVKQVARPAASEPSWHPPSEKPAQGARIVVERGNANGGPVLGLVEGVYNVIKDANGEDRWAVVDDQDKALVWHPSAVKRWRFAA